MIFLDSSALVKRYAVEEGSDEVLAIKTVVVSALALVEVTAALWRKARTGQLSDADAAVLATAARRDLGGGNPELDVVRVPLRPPVLDAAAQLAGRQGLRAYDAVQLASALVVHRLAPDEHAGFLTYDAALRAAGAREGLPVLEPGGRGLSHGRGVCR